MFGRTPRTGFSMKVNGIQPNRPDLHIVAAELGISTRDILIKESILTIYNTSKISQKIIDDNELMLFVSMALNISPHDLSDLQEVTEVIVKMEFDFEEDDDD